MEKRQTATENVQVGIALFEGRSITLTEARKILVQTNRRNKILKEEFSLTSDEIAALLVNRGKVKELASDLAQQSESEVRERIRQIETRALKAMRSPNRTRQLRALLSPR